MELGLASCSWTRHKQDLVFGQWVPARQVSPILSSDQARIRVFTLQANGLARMNTLFPLSCKQKAICLEKKNIWARRWIYSVRLSLCTICCHSNILPIHKFCLTSPPFVLNSSSICVRYMFAFHTVFMILCRELKKTREKCELKHPFEQELLRTYLYSHLKSHETLWMVPSPLGPKNHI